MITNICPKCKKKFLSPNWKKRIYCSNKCSASVRKNGKIISCKYCRKEFYGTPKANQRFCSKKCADNSRIGITFELPKLKGIHPPTEFKKGHVAWSKGKKLPQFSGKNSSRWKNGKTNHGGYIKINLFTLSELEQKLFKSMFTAGANGCLEHRIIVARILNRPIFKERVHHINEIKSDNRPTNLYLFPDNQSHTAYHTLLRHGLVKPIIKSNLV